MRRGIMASKQTSAEETGGENTEVWHKVSQKDHFLDFLCIIDGSMGMWAWMFLLLWRASLLH